MDIIDSPSPNHNARPAGAKPTLIVIHGTVGSDSGDLGWIRDPVSKVSYHYLIQRNGKTHRIVRPEQRAWHAGESVWDGKKNVNDY
ncbi:MAG TPA: N-acetylmuramoyl-L-alanine amidase, partial [Longimicrobium sp.]|nr:N-acetylmuramoyl-L-alanine amidase [Longimicrobium sp.]